MIRAKEFNTAYSKLLLLLIFGAVLDNQYCGYYGKHEKELFKSAQTRPPD